MADYEDVLYAAEEHSAFGSTNVRSFQYFLEQRRLRITFKKRTVYDYFGVDEATVRGLYFAASKGRYHHRRIRKSLQYRKVG